MPDVCEEKKTNTTAENRRYSLTAVLKGHFGQHPYPFPHLSLYANYKVCENNILQQEQNGFNVLSWEMSFSLISKGLSM